MAKRELIKTYTVAYTMFAGDIEKHVDVLANNKIEAYEKAEMETIPAIEETHAYAVWVYSVTHGTGREQRFNTFAGKRF